MKVFLIILIYIFYFNPANAQINAITENGRSVILGSDGTWIYVDNKKSFSDSPQFNFRGSHWGDSIQEVNKRETAKEIKTSLENERRYSDTIAGLKAIISYQFYNNKLYTTKYYFIHKHSNNNKYLKDYNNLKKILSNKYGEPMREEILWQKEYYKDKRDYWGVALSKGDVIFYSRWIIRSTMIILGLSGDNNQVVLAVDYSDKIISDKVRKELDEKQADVF